MLTRFWWPHGMLWGFPSGSAVKNLPENAEDPGSIPGPGRSPREGNGNPFQYSWQSNLMDRRAWLATVHEFAKSRPWLKQLSIHIHGMLWGRPLRHPFTGGHGDLVWERKGNLEYDHLHGLTLTSRVSVGEARRIIKRLIYVESIAIWAMSSFESLMALVHLITQPFAWFESLEIRHGTVEPY